MNKRKAQAKERMIFTVGVLFVCLVGIVFVMKEILPAFGNSAEGQAETLANTIASYANVLGGVDAGSATRDLRLNQPLDVEVYEKSGKKDMYVRVTYAEGKRYEVPLMVYVEPFSKMKVSTVCVIKDNGKICMKGDAQECKTC